MPISAHTTPVATQDFRDNPIRVQQEVVVLSSLQGLTVDTLFGLIEATEHQERANWIPRNMASNKRPAQEYDEATRAFINPAMSHNGIQKQGWRCRGGTKDCSTVNIADSRRRVATPEVRPSRRAKAVTKTLTVPNDEVHSRRCHELRKGFNKTHTQFSK